MAKYALLGRTLEHSFSQKYFREKFKRLSLSNHSYDLIELKDKKALESWMKEESRGYCGLNVTIPYKEDVLPYLDTLTEESMAVGAVNTISITNNELIGHNTDIHGFEKSLIDLAWIQHIERALILGTGGASKAISYVFEKLDVEYSLVSRYPKDNEISYCELRDLTLSSFDIIVNTTPLGTYPNVDELPDIPYPTLSVNSYLYDLTYNPAKTLFLRRGEENKCLTSNGLAMLEGQAEKAWEIWNKNDEE